MRRYVVMVLDDDEDRWDTLSDAERQVTYDADLRFGELLAARGGRIVGGQELTHSRDTRVARAGDDGGVLVTEGPFAETAEQIAGFYVVECDDVDVIVAAVAPMLTVHARLDIRPVPKEAS